MQMARMKATTHKKWIIPGLLLLAIVLLFCERHEKTRSMALKFVSDAAPRIFAQTGSIFSEIWGLSTNGIEPSINAHRLELLLNSRQWHGHELLADGIRSKSTSGPRRASNGSLSRLKEDISTLRQEVTHGTLDLVALYRYRMDSHMEPWEWNILRKPPLTDTLDAGNASDSTLVLVNPKSSYRVGDVITFRVDVRDGRGRAIATGGDQVRVWMVDSKNKANQAGHVIDLGNGSYVSSMPLSWPGSVHIRASIAYNSAVIRVHFFLRNIAKTVRPLGAGFVSPYDSEATLCSPFPVIQGYEVHQLCNFTDLNGGVPWYCGKPRKPQLGCRHWRYVFDTDFITPMPITEAEKTWSKCVRELRFQSIPSSLNIRVGPRGIKPRYPVMPRCGEQSLERSWTSSSPQGYFMNQVWYPSTCKLPMIISDKPALDKCVRDTTFLFLGDSNLRFAFAKLTKLIKCTPDSGPVKSRWHKPLRCQHNDTNTDIHWKPHGFPFHIGTVDVMGERTHMRSPSTYIDEIPRDGRFVVVVHVYPHYSFHHYSVFTAQIRALRSSVERVLARNPLVKLVVRGAHAIAGGFDLEATHYNEVLEREFRGLHDKVFFLQTWDMTVAIENKDLHPPDYIHMELLRIVLEYVCVNR